ncbi:MAG: trigger factor [Akkermansia sp.]|nr:trigger factor [Akkermansia sp.]
MDISVDIQPDCTATLKATIGADVTTQRRNAIVDSYAAQAKIPGFRPGKTPKSIIAKRYKEQIESELLGELFDSVCREALEQNVKLKVLNFGTPDHSFDEAGAYTVSSTMTIVPEFELPEYKGIEVTAPSEEVTDADMEQALTQLAEQTAEFEPVEREAQMDDVCVIDFKSTLDGQPLAEALGKPAGFMEGREGQWMKVEEDSFLPGFASSLAGMKAGESKDITVEIPESFPVEDLRNKTLVMATTVVEVREKKLPAIDDEFAKRMMGGTLDELKEAMKARLASQKKMAANEAKADQITEKLADMLDFNLPEVIVERELHGVLQQKLQEAMYSGNVPADMDKFVEEAREDARKSAVRNLKVFFMLQEIAQKENIAVSDEELYYEVAAQAKRQKKNLKSYIRELHRDGRMHGIRLSLLTAKVLDFLTGEAKVTISEQ